jgi:hypothetical protein
VHLLVLVVVVVVELGFLEHTVPATKGRSRLLLVTGISCTDGS